ncbi:MAG: DegT/DnrJ/EryC1/StrS family aminotransferase [Candidatus Methanosuratus sp.]|nr:DegT/DnrJ/EryC1/StrS family aminotransferase [Candidatus Methanosuratincola sp.]
MFGGRLNVQAFEKELTTYSRAKYAVAVNSGTAAPTTAMIATGIGNGDELVVHSFTFVATTSGVMLVGAKWVFVDIGMKKLQAPTRSVVQLPTRRRQKPVHRKST